LHRTWHGSPLRRETDDHRAPLNAPRSMRLARVLPILLHLVAATLHAQAAPRDEPDRAISAAAMRAHVAFLADDLLEGRAPGTRGGDLAARYIAAQFQRIGLQPVGGAFRQPVVLHGWTAERSLVEIEAAGRRIALRSPAEIIAWTGEGAATADVAAELIFVGHGVTAPEYRWDDFKNVDVRGRILLILANDPPAPPEEPGLFDGLAMTYYGRYTYKYEEAIRRGALGAIIIHTDAGAGYPWSVVEASWTGEQLFLPRDPTNDRLSVEGWIRSESARFALAATGRDLDELVARAGRRDFQPVATGLTLRARIQGRTRRIDTSNVAGLLPGSHPNRRNEVVIYTAHYDHLGIGTPVDGDSIYNGAYDNASGVAVLLEVAGAFARAPRAPDRSILFLATTAEEAGLLGARHYVRNPAYPIARTAAVINIDGANLWGETSDIAAVGAERSTLGRTVEARARELGLRLRPERAPEKGLFYRSDQFPFARAGVPAIYIEHGLDYRGRPPGWGERTLARYEALHYHRPSDRYDPGFDFAGAVQQARLAFLVGWDVASSPSMPEWYEHSEFRRPRDRAAASPLQP
jgi:Zn-dependent M28 family amino/carboxypeptidase